MPRKPRRRPDVSSAQKLNALCKLILQLVDGIGQLVVHPDGGALRLTCLDQVSNVDAVSTARLQRGLVTSNH